MSLIDRFTAKTLCIGVTPAHLTCVIRNGRSFAMESARRIDIVNENNDWRLVLAALQRYLQQPERPGAGLPISVILSSQWCRMMIVPWSDAMLKDGSMARFLQSQYMALYGDEARDWAIATDDAGYGQPRLACGMERDLLQGLQQLALDNKHACQSIESVVSVAWRAIADVSGGEHTAFAVAEPRWLTICKLEKGRITAVHSQACDSAWPAELVRAWQRWTLRLPELAAITQVALLNLTGEVLKDALPAPFKSVLLPSHELQSAYGFVTCDRGR